MTTYSDGLLRIQVRQGTDLAIRDAVGQTSDPYVLITHAGRKVRTSVVRKNCYPIWNENLTLPLKDPNLPINLRVYDKDTFTDDDEMGDADIDVKPFLECLKKMSLKEVLLPAAEVVDGGGTATKVVGRVQPNKKNCLARESYVMWNKGKMAQKMVLRLRNVECGEIEIQLEWLDFPGLKSPLDY